MKRVWSQEEINARKKHFEKSVWARLVVIFLGAWLITSPFTFGYESEVLLKAIPTTGIAPKDPQHMIAASHLMTLSDLITGGLVIFFGFMSLTYKKIWPSWMVALLGVWLNFAPIIFWSPSPAAYLNDTIIGTLLITFAILVPKLPFEGLVKGKEIPPGWSYNPSSWLQRIPVIIFGFLGWFISRYLSAYQLGYIDHVWDPFFGEGTFKVITSDLSRSFPISDAGLGAIAYALEGLMGCKGSPSRWRTMPWFVLIFGILVVPLGFCSILLVMMQPIVVGAWCGLCLVTACGMLIMIALTVDEVVAVLQYLHQCKKQKLPLWNIFWYGGCPEGASDDLRTPYFTSSKQKFKAMIWGTQTIAWNLIITALVGIWLMSTPQLFSIEGALANNTHVFGALSVAISIISWSEVARALRYILLPVGVWILISPWVLNGAAISAEWNYVISGLLLIIFSFRKGRIVESYGDWNQYIR